MKKAYQADPIVYNESTEYGANQVSPHEVLGKNPYEREELQKVVKAHFPIMEDEDVKAFLYRLDREGCGYVSMINSLFDAYAEKPDTFREIFGFSMYDIDGTLNFNRVLVDLYCQMDNHNEDRFGFFSWDTYNPIEDQKKLDEDKDGVFEWTSKPCGNNQDKMKYRWETYCKRYGIKADVQIEVPVTPKNFLKYARKGSVSILSSDFTMYSEDGKATHVKNGHFMTITDVTEDGKYVVSSWGEKYYLNPDDIKGFVHYQLIRYK